MNTTLKKVLIGVLTVLIIGGLLTLDALYLAPKQLKVRYETLSSPVIPEDLNGLSICVFSDLHYNNYVDKTRAQKIVDTINEQNPDVVIFLGDLFDHPSVNVPGEVAQEDLISLLSSINAPYGKFAVYGNHDLESPTATEIVSQVLYKGGFEIKKNENFKIHLGKKAGIQMIALDCQLLGTIDPVAAFANSDENLYRMVICHTPDTIDELSDYPFDYMVAGHSHGGQLYIPLIGAIYIPQYAYNYNHGKYVIDNKTLDITNGVGTTRKDIRLFADQEIVIYRFYHR